MTDLRTAWVIAAKDLRLERRTHDVVGSAGLFALLILVTASFTLPTWGEGREAVAAGVLWMAVLFASLLGVGRSQSIENEQRCLDALLVAPVRRDVIFLGKVLAGLMFTWAVAAVLTPTFIVLMQVDGASLALLAIAVLLGTTGLVGVGSLFAMLTGHTRMQQPLLPVLVMPVSVPLMIAAVETTSAALAGAAVVDSLRWLALLVGFDAIFILVAVLTVPYLVEER